MHCTAVTLSKIGCAAVVAAAMACATPGVPGSIAPTDAMHDPVPGAPTIATLPETLLKNSSVPPEALRTAPPVLEGTERSLFETLGLDNGKPGFWEGSGTPVRVPLPAPVRPYRLGN